MARTKIARSNPDPIVNPVDASYVLEGGCELGNPPSPRRKYDSAWPGQRPVPPGTIPIYDRDAVRREIERMIGRTYYGDQEEHYGSPIPQLSTDEQPRLDQLRALYDDERGPDRALLFGSDGIVSALNAAKLLCPGFVDVIDLVSRATALSIMTGAALSIPPLLLAGPPGIGKTHASLAIAEALGVEIHNIACGSNSDAQALLVGHPSTWRGAKPGTLTSALIRGATAQPVILLDEIDKLCTHHTEQPYNVLLSALEPENSRALVDQYLNVPVDLSRALIAATANDISVLPTFIIDRLTVIEIVPPSHEALMAIARLIASRIVIELNGRVEMPDDVILQRLARHNPRGIGKLLQLAFGYAAAAARDHLIIADIEAAERFVGKSKQHNSIGFLGRQA